MGLDSPPEVAEAPASSTSYRHGLRRRQIDSSAAMIRMLEKLGLAWGVVRVDPARRAGRLLAAEDG